jgi:hypothetical protein
MDECWMCRDFGKEERHSDHADSYAHTEEEF